MTYKLTSALGFETKKMMYLDLFELKLFCSGLYFVSRRVMRLVRSMV